MSQNLVYLDLYFEDLKKSEIVENAADGQASLISDIGGQLGLWLGMSILTVAELAYCFCILLPRTTVRLLGLKISRLETARKLKSFFKNTRLKSKSKSKTTSSGDNEGCWSTDNEEDGDGDGKTYQVGQVDEDTKITNWCESKKLKAPIVVGEDFEIS